MSRWTLYDVDARAVELTGQSLCGWAWDRGAEWAAQTRRESEEWAKAVITFGDMARFAERERCAELATKGDAYRWMAYSCGNERVWREVTAALRRFAAAIRERGKA